MGDATEPLVPIFDGHNDALSRIHDRNESIGLWARGRGEGHVDLPRCRAGGMFGGFYAVFTPSPSSGSESEAAAHGPSPARVMTSAGDDPYRFRLPPAIDGQVGERRAEALVAGYEELLALRSESGEPLARAVLASADLSEALDRGQHAVLLHFEGAEPIRTDLSNLERWYERGLRSLGIVWSRPNEFGNGVRFAYPATPDEGDGLSAAGRDLVRRCNELGIVVDLSHLNAAGFWDVAEISQHPLAVTHTAVHRLSAKPRNLLDEQIDAVAHSGGVVGLNFNCADVRRDGRWLAETSLDDHVRHLDALVERIGDDHVALGSDFDGALMPRELADASYLQVLIRRLRAGGWPERSLAKLGWRNWRRLLERTIDHARGVAG